MTEVKRRLDLTRPRWVSDRAHQMSARAQSVSVAYIVHVIEMAVAQVAWAKRERVEAREEWLVE